MSKALAKAGDAPNFFSQQVEEVRRFYLNLNPSPRTTLAVLCGGREQCNPNYTVRRTTFPYYAIEYVVRGRGRLKLAHRDFELEPGTVFSYGPGVPHVITVDPAAPPVKYFVDFTGTRSGTQLQEGGLSPGTVAHVFPPFCLAPLFDELIDTGLRASRNRGLLCSRLLECLLLKSADSLAPGKGPDTQAFLTYRNCREHIEKHYMRLRTLEQIAAECHVNNAYLCRLFRRYDHQTPYQHLLRLKMNYAAGRLQQPGVLVKQVTQETGFTDAFHFSRVFKTVLGLSPADFRSRMTKSEGN